MNIFKPAIILEHVPAGLENKTSKLRQLARENNFDTVRITRTREKGYNIKINGRPKSDFSLFLSSPPSDLYTFSAYTYKNHEGTLFSKMFSIKCKKATPSKVFEEVRKAFEDAFQNINKQRIESGIPPITKAENINQTAKTTAVQQKNNTGLIARIKNFFKPAKS